MHLQDKVCLVTGAARGIGKSFAEALLEKGAKVAIADILEDAGKQTVEELCSRFGNRAMFVKCNVTNKEDCEDVFQKVQEQFGPVELLINNAGVVGMTMEDWDKLIAVNLTSVVRLTKLAMNLMDKKQGGKGGIIINMSSIAGVDVCPGSGLYAASKHAVTGFTRTMAANCRENPEGGVRVFALAPCWVKTDMTRAWHQNMDMIKEQHPGLHKYIEDTGGFVEPELISQALIDLVAEEPEEEDFLLVTGYGKKYLHFRDLYASVLSG